MLLAISIADTQVCGEITQDKILPDSDSMHHSNRTLLCTS